MEGLSGKAEELGSDYDRRPYGGQRLWKLVLDTQWDVSRRTAAIIFIIFRRFIELSVSLESENEGLIQPGHGGLDSRCLCCRVFCTYEGPLQGLWKKCRSTITVNTSLHMMLCRDNTVC